MEVESSDYCEETLGDNLCSVKSLRPHLQYPTYNTDNGQEYQIPC